MLIGLLASFLLAFSPANDTLERIIAAFERSISERPQEKVYLHLDRPYYAAGETVWFKAYLTAGPYHEPSLLSQTIYVELIDGEGQIVQHLRLFAPDGSASGQLFLPDSLGSGNYLVRSYTNWMRNSGEAYFFHRELKIWNSETVLAANANQGTLDIQFFPEGGNLVDGIMSKVAFKVIGDDGLGKAVKGKILDGAKVIAEFESNPLGMGVFPLVPEKGKQYKALVGEPGQEVILPASQDSGIVMSVTNSPRAEDIMIKIQASGNSDIQSVNLLAQTRGLVCASSRADLSKKILFVRIPKREFPSGIAQITALDGAGIPLAERLVFIDHQDHLSISVSTDKSAYAPRDPVRIEVEARNKDGKPVTANLSLSVFDSGQILADENKETIQSNLLISSELKGHIESPGYYFNPENPDRQEALDFLMLTQGWRRFTIKEALNAELQKPVYRIEKGLTIRGVLNDPKTNKPVDAGTVSYLSLFPVVESKTAVSTASGEFELQDLVYYDSAAIVLQGKSKNGKSPASVLAESSYTPPILDYRTNPRFVAPTDLERNFLSNAEVRKNIDRAFDFDTADVSLGAVEVRGKRIVEPYAGPRIYGSGTAAIKVAGNSGLENQQHPLDLIKGRVAGVQVSGSGQNWKVVIQGVGSINSSTEPLIMVDDIPVRLESLHTIPVYDIESVTVWKGPDTAVFGARGTNGAIGFYTKKKTESSSPPAEKATDPSVSGYQIEQEFYSPKYAVQGPAQAKPDRRVTLFWAPNILTDSSGKATVLFFNHDVETVIHGEIEGLGESGSPGTSRFHYKIEK